VNPPVIIWDATATVLVIVVELRRQDHRLGLWLGSLASHATSVAGLSSVPACVADSPPHEHPARHVEERQAASLGFLAHDLHHLVNAFWLAALVWPPCVHLRCLGAAGTGWRWLNAESLQEAGKLGAGAVVGRLGG
jgi:hypothetical protein